MTKEARTLIEWVTKDPGTPLDAATAQQILSLGPLELKTTLEQVVRALLGRTHGPAALRALEAALAKTSNAKPQRKQAP